MALVPSIFEQSVMFGREMHYLEETSMEYGDFYTNMAGDF